MFAEGSGSEEACSTAVLHAPHAYKPPMSLQVVSLVSEEVFSFGLSLFPGAVEGDDYRDMSKVDGRVSMRLGCIQIVYLHKFLMSLLVSHYTHTQLHTLADTHRLTQIPRTYSCILLSVLG